MGVVFAAVGWPDPGPTNIDLMESITGLQKELLEVKQGIKLVQVTLLQLTKDVQLMHTKIDKVQVDLQVCAP